MQIPEPRKSTKVPQATTPAFSKRSMDQEGVVEVTRQVHAVKIPFKLVVGSGKTLERFVYAYILYGRKICLMAESQEHRA